MLAVLKRRADRAQGAPSWSAARHGIHARSLTRWASRSLCWHHEATAEPSPPDAGAAKQIRVREAAPGAGRRYAHLDPGVEAECGAVWASIARAAGRPRSSRGTATRRSWRALGILASSARSHRDEIRHSQRTDVREVEEPFAGRSEGHLRRCRTSGTRSAARTCRAWRASVRAYVQGGASRTSRSGRARTISPPPSSGWSFRMRRPLC